MGRSRGRQSKCRSRPGSIASGKEQRGSRVDSPDTRRLPDASSPTSRPPHRRQQRCDEHLHQPGLVLLGGPAHHPDGQSVELRIDEDGEAVAACRTESPSGGGRLRTGDEWRTAPCRPRRSCAATPPQLCSFRIDRGGASPQHLVDRRRATRRSRPRIVPAWRRNLLLRIRLGQDRRDLGTVRDRDRFIVARRPPGR